MSSKQTFGLVALAALAFVLLNAVYIVPQTHQALVLRFGKAVDVKKDPGLHVKMPFVDNVEMFDKRLIMFNADAKEVIASDQKRLIVDAFVSYKITDPLKFKQTVGSEFNMNNRLNDILEDALRQAVGDVPLASIISTRRGEIMDQVRRIVNLQARGIQTQAEEGTTSAPPKGGFGINVIDARIITADLPEANSLSIYRRMQTERERDAKDLRARGAEDAQKIRAIADKERTVLIAEAEKEAEKIRGEGDKKALEIFAKAANQGPEFYDFYRSLQAYRKTVSPSDTTVILSPEGEFLKHME